MATRSYISDDQRATVDRYFGTHEDNILRFAVEGGKNIDINTTWGLDGRTFYQQRDFAIASGKTLIIAAGGYTHHMNNYGITLNGTIQKQGAIAPTNTTGIRRKTGGAVIMYGLIQSAINAGVSGDTVSLAADSYNESITMRSGVHLTGKPGFRSGSGAAYFLTGAVDFNTVSGIQVRDIRFYVPVTLFSSSSINFTTCDFWNASTYTASVTNGTANFFTDCDFWTSTDALLLNNSDPFVDDCKFHGTTRYGINCTSGSEPDVFDANHLYENWSYEIRADATCGDIFATNNYWNPVPPEVSHEGSPGAQIFVDPYFAHKPAIAGVDDDPAAAVTLRRVGRQLLREGEAAGALTRFQEVIESYPESRSAQLSVGHAVSAYQRLKQEREALRYLEDLARRARSREVMALALFHTIPLLVELDEGVKAVTRADELIQTYPSSRYERLGLFNKGFILAKRGDRSGSAQTFASLIEKYPDAEEASVAAVVTGGSSPQTARREESRITATSLGPNYPNPFNPITQIRFELPQSEKVYLDIYNVHGQRVRRLVKADYPAGPHVVQWDGRDDAGKGVASGVYFYRLSAGAFTQTRKMLLLK